MIELDGAVASTVVGNWLNTSWLNICWLDTCWLDTCKPNSGDSWQDRDLFFASRSRPDLLIGASAKAGSATDSAAGRRWPCGLRHIASGCGAQ
jgi:hypothetical protein